MQPLSGICCANYGNSRGTSRVCQGIWHAACYKQSEHDKFPVYETADLDDALLDGELHGEMEDDDKRFQEARTGDDLMNCFQCDDCAFYNMQGRYPLMEHDADSLLMLCIRRANLDAFWSRERTTVERNWREMKSLIATSKTMGLHKPLPQRGPFRIADDVGMNVACVMLMKTLRDGRNSKHIQFESARKVRSAVSNLMHSLPGGTGLSTVAQGERGGQFFSASPTNSYWFRRFMSGCHKSMGDVWLPDQAVTVEEIKAGLAILEEEWSGGAVGHRKTELALTGALVVVGYAAALRGEEIPQIDVGLMRKYWEEGLNYERKRHVPLALAGRFKQTSGTFRIFIQPLADVTSSGIAIRTWIERAIRCLDSEGVKSGPMFRTVKRQGKIARATVGDLDSLFQPLWKGIQHHRHPQLIVESTKIEDVYSARRSFRQGATTEAQNRNIPDDIIQTNNRWKKHLKGRGILPSMSMIERYSDAKASVESLVRFSELM